MPSRPSVGLPGAGLVTQAEQVITSLCQTIDEVLQELIPEGSRCALLDFPTHHNVGDHAIWLGENAWLRRHRIELVYTCDMRTYERIRLAKRLGAEGIILLSGGGNFGDLYPAHQQFREMIAATFPHHQIIQFPQTIWFAQPTHLDRARAAFANHPKLTVLARDHRSLEIARHGLKVSAGLCPDMAFMLGRLPRVSRPSVETLWVWRKECASACRTLRMQPGDKVTDWSDGSPATPVRLLRCLEKQLVAHPRARHGLRQLMALAPDRIARAYLNMGCRMLSQGQVIVTDRLHGHILSLLLGLPHIVFDDQYGKVQAFYETWTKGCGLTRWVDSPAEAQRASAVSD